MFKLVGLRNAFAVLSGDRSAVETSSNLAAKQRVNLGRLLLPFDHNLAEPAGSITLNACAETVAADNIIQEREAEVLRAIADAFDCPIPPFISMQLDATVA